MPKSLSIDEIFGHQTEDHKDAPVQHEDDGPAYSLDEIFQAEQPAAATAPPAVAPTIQPGIPYPVAPADALGLPKDLKQPSGITKFAEELPGVLGDVAQATKGVIRDTLWEDMTDDEKTAGKRLFDDLREVQGTRAPLQGALQFTKTLHGVINHPLALAGTEGADESADQADRIVTALGQENSRRAAEGLIAQAFGETAGEISESVISSLVEQYLGARLLGGAGKGGTVLQQAKRGTRAAMLYTGLSAGNHALTEAKDELGLTGAKRWGYAGAVGAINSAFIAAGGALAHKLGIEDVAQAMFTDTTPVIANVLAKSGVKQAMSTLLKGLGGTTLEAGEEAGTQFTADLTKAAFDGDPEGALDRMIAKTKDEGFIKNVAMAGLTGAAARGAVGAFKNLSSALETAKTMLPDSLTQIGETVRSRQNIEALDVQAEAEAETPPETPPEAAVAPEQGQTPIAPPTEVGTVEAPQGAPLAPVPDAAVAALPSGEPVAGAPPAEAPATPPGDASVSPPQDPIKLANAPMEELARSLGRGESYYSPGTRGLREAAELAVAANVPERAVSIAHDILENKRPLTSTEEVGLGLRAQKVSAQLQQNRVRMQGANDETQIRSLAAEANQLGEEFDTIKEALQLGGTDPARLLAYRRWAFPDDLTEESIVARVKVSRKAPATEGEKAFAKKVSAEHSDNAKKLVVARKKQKHDVAEEALAGIKKEGAPSGDLETINTRIRALLDAGCNLE